VAEGAQPENQRWSCDLAVISIRHACGLHQQCTFSSDSQYPVPRFSHDLEPYTVRTHASNDMNNQVTVWTTNGLSISPAPCFKACGAQNNHFSGDTTPARGPVKRGPT
jgi:hypothetical protein